MKHRNAFVLAAVVLLSPLVVHAAGQDADAARFTIMAPVQAAYDAYQATASRAQHLGVALSSTPHNHRPCRAPSPVPSTFIASAKPGSS